MDKLRKMLYIPVACHSALFIGMVIVAAMKINPSVFVLLDWCGVLLSPIFLSVLSVAHAIVHEGKVSDYLKDSLICLLAISTVRVVLYSIFAFGVMPVAAACALISFGVFLIWDGVFMITDNVMKKRPKRRK